MKRWRTVYIYAPEGRVAGAQRTFPPNGQTPPPDPPPWQPGQQPTPGEAPQPQ